MYFFFKRYENGRIETNLINNLFNNTNKRTFFNSKRNIQNVYRATMTVFWVWLPDYKCSELAIAWIIFFWFVRYSTHFFWPNHPNYPNIPNLWWILQFKTIHLWKNIARKIWTRRAFLHYNEVSVWWICNVEAIHIRLGQLR